MGTHGLDAIAASRPEPWELAPLGTLFERRSLRWDLLGFIEFISIAFG